MTTFADQFSDVAAAVCSWGIVVGCSVLTARGVVEICKRVGEAHERAFYARHGEEPPDRETVYSLLPPFVWWRKRSDRTLIT